MECSEDVSGTLRTQEHGHQPLVLATQQGGAEIGVGTYPATTAAAGTSGNNQPVLLENHGIDSWYMGPYAAAPTVFAHCGTGGNNVPLVSQKAESLRVAGNIIDCQPGSGGNGFESQADIAYTPTGMDRHAVSSRQRSGELLENEVPVTQGARQHKDATDLIAQPYQQIVGTPYMDDDKGISDQYVDQDKCIVENRSLTRRPTPLECEKLQSFSDDWTDIPSASGSVRYKALGNSIAILCVGFVLRGIARFLHRIREECPDSL